jgi:hypothetical protein
MAFALCCNGGPIVLKSSECMPAVVSASARTAPTATAATGRRPARLRLLAAISRGAITNGSNPSIQRRASEARKPPIITLITRALVMRAGMLRGRSLSEIRKAPRSAAPASVVLWIHGAAKLANAVGLAATISATVRHPAKRVATRDTDQPIAQAAVNVRRAGDISHRTR